jgi:hypothetical protein
MSADRFTPCQLIGSRDRDLLRANGCVAAAVAKDFRRFARAWMSRLPPPAAYDSAEEGWQPLPLATASLGSASLPCQREASDKCHPEGGFDGRPNQHE